MKDDTKHDITRYKYHQHTAGGSSTLTGAENVNFVYISQFACQMMFRDDKVE